MKAVVITRVSSPGQEDGVSFDAQEERSRAWCRERGMDILTPIHRIVESSTRGERKQFHQALKHVMSQKEPTALVVHSTDRLLRGWKEYGLLQELMAQGHQIHLVSERLVLDKKSDWTQVLQFDMYVFGAKIYVEQLRGHVNKAIQHNIKHGNVIGRVPTGYLNYRDPISGKATVVLDPDRTLIIKRLFQEYATGTYSVRELAHKAAVEWGLTNPKTGKPLTAGAVDDLLKNPYYIGYMRHPNGVAPHNYPKLIDEALFERCQLVREGNRTKPVVATEKPFIFRGLMKCASCGCAICSDLKKGKYTYLFCTKAKGKDKCNSKRIREEEAIKVVERVLERLVLPEPLIEDIRQYLIEVNEAGQQEFRQRRSGLERELHELEKGRERLVELCVRGSMPIPEYEKRRQDVDNKIQRIKTQLESCETGRDDFEDSLILVLKMVSNMKGLFRRSKLEQKRKIIRFVFSNLYLDGEKVGYELNTVFDKLVALDGCKVWWSIGDSNS